MKIMFTHTRVLENSILVHGRDKADAILALLPDHEQWWVWDTHGKCRFMSRYFGGDAVMLQSILIDASEANAKSSAEPDQTAVDPEPEAVA